MIGLFVTRTNSLNQEAGSSVTNNHKIGYIVCLVIRLLLSGGFLIAWCLLLLIKIR